MLHCIFGPGNAGYAQDESWAPYARLNKYERRALIPEGFSWCLPFVLMAVQVPGVCDQTIDLIVRRYQLQVGPDFYTIARWAAQWIDERDPQEIRDQAEKFLDQPFKNLELAEPIFRHWLLDRYNGLRCNVGLASNLEWVAGLKLPATCPGDDLQRPDDSPAYLLDDLLEARGERQRQLYSELYQILDSCLHHPQPAGHRDFDQFREQVSDRLAEVSFEHLAPANS